MNNDTVNREVFVAIAHALHIEISKNMHDTESYKLTIKQNPSSAWSLKTQSMRTLPRR